MLGSSKNREETPYFGQKNTHVSKYIKKNILDIIQSVLTRNTNQSLKFVACYQVREDVMCIWKHFFINSKVSLALPFA